MAIAIDERVDRVEQDLSFINPEDEILRILCRRLNLNRRGSDLTEEELKRLIDEQISRNTQRGKLVHRTMYQFAEIRTHQYYLSEKCGFHIDGDHAAKSWIDDGYAGMFERSYPLQLAGLAA